MSQPEWGHQGPISQFENLQQMSEQSLTDLHFQPSRVLSQESLERPDSQISITEQFLITQVQKLAKEIKALKIDDQHQLQNDLKVISDKIYSLPSEEWEVTTPINIIIKISSKEVMALIPDLGLYSDGRNEMEAVANLKLEILDLLDDLNAIPDAELGSTPKGWKKSLTLLVKQCQ